MNFVNPFEEAKYQCTYLKMVILLLVCFILSNLKKERSLPYNLTSTFKHQYQNQLLFFFLYFRTDEEL